jgi:hypothetical protein
MNITQEPPIDAPAVNLPESLFVPVSSAVAGRDNGGIEAIKAVGPGGVPVAVAFTARTHLDAFAGLVGLSAGAFGVMEIPTADLLAQLADAAEPELCVDPGTADERHLHYTAPSVIARRHLPHGSGFEVRPPTVGLPVQFLDSLKKVAAGLPQIEDVWMLELALSGQEGEPDSVRPLVVVRQSLERENEMFDEAFMELGNQWCETLPRGIAVDMLPHDAPPVADKLDAACRLYNRCSS